MTKSPFSAVFFDMDETLIEHTLTGATLFGEMHREHADSLDGVSLEKFGEALRIKGNELWGMMFGDIFQGDTALTFLFKSTLKELDLDPSLADSMARTFEDLVLENTEVIPGAEQVVATLRGAGITVGIITNGFTGLQSLKIEHHRLGEMVDHVFISQSMGAHKPDNAIFEGALAAVGASPERAMHIGDHVINDVTGAIDAGMLGVLYDPRGDRLKNVEEESARTPSHVIERLEEVLGIVGLEG